MTVRNGRLPGREVFTPRTEMTVSPGKFHLIFICHVLTRVWGVNVINARICLAGLLPPSAVCMFTVVNRTCRHYFEALRTFWVHEANGRRLGGPPGAPHFTGRSQSVHSAVFCEVRARTRIGIWAPLLRVSGERRRVPRARALNPSRNDSSLGAPPCTRPCTYHTIHLKSLWSHWSLGPQ